MNTRISSQRSEQGSLLFAKYAFAPNKLRYCGPGDNRAIFDYCVANHSDQGLIQLLKNFEGAYPYLQLIAKTNKIKDPFDERVAEAYWLGNNLLNNVTTSDFHQQLKNRFSKKLSPNLMKWLLPKPAEGAKPHHSFHVLDVYTKTGLIRSGIKTNVMETINNCLILPGKVTHATCNMKHVTYQTLNSKSDLRQAQIALNQLKGENLNKFKILNSNFQNSKSYKLKANSLIVEFSPIVLKNGKLIFGDLTAKEVACPFVNPKVGDWVSVHWGSVCDILTLRQLKNLQSWTKYHMKIANNTI